MTAFIFAVLLFAAVPISLVLALTAAFYVWYSGNTILFSSFGQQLFAGIETYGLMAIPLFMLAGELMNEGGLTRRLVSLARVLVGGFRGGLAYINLVANMFMAAIIGSAASQIAIMSRAMVPEMEREGYDRSFAAAITAAGGLLSPIIPPSMLFVIYGVLAQVPIGDMFLAGVIPGLMLSAAFFVVIALIGLRQDFPAGRRMTPGERRAAVLGGLPAAGIPVIIIGGITLGIATPTESAALASFFALMIGRFVHGDLDLARLGPVLMRTAMNSALVIFLIATANVFGWIIIYESVPQRLAATLAALTENPFVFLLMINLLLLFVGMIIDGIAALVIVVPILLPIAQTQFGIDPFHFGVVICINLVLGLLTPPVGAGLYIAASMSGAPLFGIFRALAPFLAATLVILVFLSWSETAVTLLIR